MSGLLVLVNSASGKILYSEFSGYREWPVAPGSMADTEYVIPVYRTWPDKPFVVLGSLKYDDPRRRWEPSSFKSFAKEAKKRGGEAMIVRYGSEVGVLASVGTKSPDLAYLSGQPTALVIRFLSREELARREAQQKAVFRDYLAKNPPAGFSEETGSIAIKCLLQSNLKHDDPEFSERFAELMKRVVQRGAGLGGEWIFKCVLKVSNITTSDEKTAFGTAMVETDGTNIVVVSKEGPIEFNFSGACAGAKLSGQLGIAGFSAKAEGIALDTKISVTYQTLTASGTAQGSVVLQRNGLPRTETTPSQATPQKL